MESVLEQQQQQQQQPNTQQQQVRVASTFIQYNNLIYGLHGLADAENFNNMTFTFGKVMGGFSVLTDPDKLNRQPDRLKIKTSSRSQTLQQALQAEGVTSAQLQELAILNGMKLTDRLTAGMKFKVIRNGNF